MSLPEAEAPSGASRPSRVGGKAGPSQRAASDPGGRVKMALQAPHLLGIICQGLALSWVRCATPLTCELEGNKEPCAEMTQRLFVF